MKKEKGIGWERERARADLQNPLLHSREERRAMSAHILQGAHLPITVSAVIRKFTRLTKNGGQNSVVRLQNSELPCSGGKR